MCMLTEFPSRKWWMTAAVQTKARAPLCQRGTARAENKAARPREGGRAGRKSSRPPKAAPRCSTPLGRAAGDALAELFDEPVGEAAEGRELERPRDVAAVGRLAQRVEVELIFEVALVGV